MLVSIITKEFAYFVWLIYMHGITDTDMDNIESLDRDYTTAVKSYGDAVLRLNVIKDFVFNELAEKSAVHTIATFMSQT